MADGWGHWFPVSWLEQLPATRTPLVLPHSLPIRLDSLYHSLKYAARLQAPIYHQLRLSGR